MDALIQSGEVALWLIGVVALEFLLLTLFFFRTGKGVPPLDLLFMLSAGGALMLALGAALSGAGSAVIGGLLIVSLVAHLCDLWRRWR